MFKRKKNENGEELENIFDVFIRNYRMVPGFRALIQLGGYFLIIMIIIVVLSTQAGSISDTKKDEPTTTTVPTTTAKEMVYNDILEKLKRDNLNLYISIVLDKDTYVIDAVNNKSIIEGYYETKEGTKKIKIENGKNYEVVLNEQKENPNLFDKIDRDFVVPADLVSLLKSNYGTKTTEDDEVLYSYDIKKNNIAYEMKVYIKDNNCYKIEINSSNSNYLITYQ